MGFDPIYSKSSKINVSVVGRLVTTDASLIAETVAAVLNGVDCEMLDQQPRV